MVGFRQTRPPVCLRFMYRKTRDSASVSNSQPGHVSECCWSGLALAPSAFGVQVCSTCSRFPESCELLYFRHNAKPLRWIRAFPDSWPVWAPGGHLASLAPMGSARRLWGKASGCLSSQRSSFPTVLQASHEQEKEALTHSFQEAKTALQVRGAGPCQSL